MDGPTVRRVRSPFDDPRNFEPVQNARECRAVKLGPAPEFTRVHLIPVKKEAQDHGLGSRHVQGRDLLAPEP